MGSLESTVTSQLKTVAQEVKSEIQQSRFKGKGGDRKGKGGWNGPQGQQQQQQPRGWGRTPTLQNWQSPQFGTSARNLTAPPPQGPAGKWGSHRKPVECWNCGEDHYARNCPHQTDASNSQVHRGANAMNMALAGGGDVTTDQLEEQFGSVEEARSWVAAVYDATD